MIGNSEITYLRLSITDKCNLKCSYCTTIGTRCYLPRAEILSFEEMARVASALAQRGVHAVRITGGEPLVKRGLTNLVHMLSDENKITDLSMTTNGMLLAERAEALKSAGLCRVNVSLDTLDSDKYQMLTGSDGLDCVLDGIERALQHGLSPVKVNVVVLKGVNEDEVCDFVRFGAEHGVVVRFIEYMPMGQEECEFVPTSNIKSVIEKEFGIIHPIESSRGEGPAEYFRVADMGAVGFISPISSPSCLSCNRLRLRSDGKMYPCLLRSGYVDLRSALREGSSDSLETLLDRAVALKRTNGQDQGKAKRFPMCILGG